MKVLTINKTMCATCPFRDTGWAELRPLLIQRAMSEASPICHSTGSKALVAKSKRISGKSQICRGARNFQLELFFRMGFISAPTDEAWAEKVKEIKKK